MSREATVVTIDKNFLFDAPIEEMITHEMQSERPFFTVIFEPGFRQSQQSEGQIKKLFSSLSASKNAKVYVQGHTPKMQRVIEGNNRSSKIVFIGGSSGAQN